MAHTVRFRLDDGACAQLVALRERARAVGCDVPGERPAVTAAAAAAVPAPARGALAAELRLLTLPTLWLAVLGTTAGRPDELVLAAVVDAELLAVHHAVHDALAGRVRSGHAAYLPGSWLPHCVLATGATTAAAFASLHPVEAVRARITGVEIHDGRTAAPVGS